MENLKVEDCCHNMTNFQNQHAEVLKAGCGQKVGTRGSMSQMTQLKRKSDGKTRTGERTEGLHILEHPKPVNFPLDQQMNSVFSG